jgi:hypothetical protein
MRPGDQLRGQMNKRFISLLTAFFALITCRAQETNLLTALSPKLRSFVAANPGAMNELNRVYCSTFRTNTVQLTYFYSEDHSKPRAFHFYPHTADMADVVLCIRENQQPLDEFIDILFELLNSKNQSRFEALCEQAKAGSIQRRNFALAILRIEFESDLAVRKVLGEMRLTRKQKAESYYYDRIANCPSNFEESLTYRRKVSPQRDMIREYETQYDALRQNVQNN